MFRQTFNKREKALNGSFIFLWIRSHPRPSINSFLFANINASLCNLCLTFYWIVSSTYTVFAYSWMNAQSRTEQDNWFLIFSSKLSFLSLLLCCLLLFYRAFIMQWNWYFCMNSCTVVCVGFATWGSPHMNWNSIPKIQRGAPTKASQKKSEQTLEVWLIRNLKRREMKEKEMPDRSIEGWKL